MIGNWKKVRSDCRDEKKPKLLSLGLNPPKEEGGGDTC